MKFLHNISEHDVIVHWRNKLRRRAILSGATLAASQACNDVLSRDITDLNNRVDELLDENFHLKKERV